MSNNEKVLVLNNLQIRQKITRIAHEIYENNFNEDELYFIGIEKRGSVLSKRLAALLTEISDITIHEHTLKLNKTAPLEDPIETSIALEELAGKPVILIDDVLNSGKALIYAAKYILRAMPKKLKTAVLVDRKHRSFPVRSDYVGLTLATTLQEHIAVEFGNKDAVYLI